MAAWDSILWHGAFGEVAQQACFQQQRVVLGGMVLSFEVDAAVIRAAQLCEGCVMVWQEGQGPHLSWMLCAI